MKFFSFVMEFRGGTYISQIYASSHLEAPLKWAHSLEIQDIPFMGPKSHAELIRCLSEQEPTPLAGLRNAWCLHSLVSTGSVLIHYFETVPAESR